MNILKKLLRRRRLHRSMKQHHEREQQAEAYSCQLSAKTITLNDVPLEIRRDPHVAQEIYLHALKPNRAGRKNADRKQYDSDFAELELEIRAAQDRGDTQLECALKDYYNWELDSRCEGLIEDLLHFKLRLHEIPLHLLRDLRYCTRLYVAAFRADRTAGKKQHLLDLAFIDVEIEQAQLRGDTYLLSKLRQIADDYRTIIDLL